MSSTRKPKQGRKFRYVESGVKFDIGKVSPPRRVKSIVRIDLGIPRVPGLGMLLARIAAQPFMEARARREAAAAAKAKECNRDGHSIPHAMEPKPS